MLPRIVMPAVNAVLQRIHLRGEGVYQAVTSAFTADHLILSHTPVVVIDQVSEETVVSWSLAYSVPFGRLWGLEPRCPTEDCCMPGDIKVTIRRSGKNHDFAKFSCLRCKWATSWIPRPDFITPVANREFYFTMPFPLKLEQEMYVENYSARTVT